MNRWIEFFEGDGGRLSMTRLTCFMAFFPATYLLIIAGTENMLLYFLGAFVVGYVGGKGFDAMTSSAEAKASGPAPVIVPDAQKVEVSTDKGNVNVSRAAD